MAAQYPKRRPTIDHPFSAVPWDLISDKRLGGAEVRVYAALVRMAFEDDTGRGQYGHAEIAALSCCSERSVCRPLMKLEETGWIERRPVLTGHGRQPDHFHLHTERDSKRAEMRSGVDSNHADLRRRDHADLRGPTSLKEVEKELTLLSEDHETADKAPSAKSLDEEFEVWWQEWPKIRRENKKAARAEYHKARKRGHDAKDILDGCIAYARLHTAQRTEAKFIVHPSRWLKNERWTDEVGDAPSPFEPPPMRFG